MVRSPVLHPPNERLLVHAGPVTSIITHIVIETIWRGVKVTETTEETLEAVEEATAATEYLRWHAQGARQVGKIGKIGKIVGGEGDSTMAEGGCFKSYTVAITASWARSVKATAYLNNRCS